MAWPGTLFSSMSGGPSPEPVDRVLIMNRHEIELTANGLLQPFGLYSNEQEHDSRGVGFVAHIKGAASRQIIEDAERILRHMTHSRRLRPGCEENTGDGVDPDRCCRTPSPQGRPPRPQ